MTRRALTSYVGATARLTPDAGLALPGPWGYQPKIDGCYAHAILDGDGRIASILSRTGARIPDADDLIGIVAGPPRSLLVGELEAHTEAGAAAYARQGFRRMHLFDLLALDGRSVSDLPYADRYRLLAADRVAHVEARGLATIASWVEVEVAASPGGSRPGARRTDGATTTQARCPLTGRLVRRIPRDLRRLPVVPLVQGHEAARELWSTYVERDGGEGLVAVRLDARVGRPGAKRKIKLTDTADVRVVATSPGVIRATCPTTSPGGWRGQTFVVQSSQPLPIGAVVEVAHDGCYGSGVPRFPRVVRKRDDLR